MIDLILKELLGNGVLGVICAYLFWQNSQLSKRIDEMDKEKDGIHEARAGEVRNQTDAMNNFGFGLKSIKNEIGVKLDALRDAIKDK